MSQEDLCQTEPPEKRARCEEPILNKSIEKLICQLCGNYLSVAPIYLVEDIGFICGRCQKVESEFTTNPKKERQWLYEEVARNFIFFPCINDVNGCNVKLKFGDVKDHEKSCCFKKNTCFFADKKYCYENDEKCEWSGEYDELTDHLKTAHTSQFVDLPIKIHLTEDEKNVIMKKKNKLILTRVSGEVAIVVLQFEKNFYCSFMTFFRNSAAKYKNFKVEIVDGFNKLLSTSIKHKITKKCSISSHHLENVKVKIIDMSFFEVLSDQSYISVDLSDTVKNLPKEDSLVLRNVSCEYCKKKVYPPFYICKRNHNICVMCKVNEVSSVCLECKSFAEIIQKFDEISEFCYQECKNKKEGCVYVDNAWNIARHEKVCIFNQWTCLFPPKCEWKGYVKEVHEHIKLKHHFGPFGYQIKFMNSCRDHFFFDDQVFLFQQQNNGNHFVFYCSCITQQTLTVSYMIDLNISNDTNLNYSKVCLKYFVKPHYAKEEDKRIIIPKTLLAQVLLEEQKISWSINISRVKTNR